VNDPKRWSEAGESSEEERELLLAGRAARMPESERRALWAGIAASLPGPPHPPGAATGAAPTASGLSAYVTKGLIFLAAVGGVTLGTWKFWPEDAPKAKPVPVTLDASTVKAPPAAPSSSPVDVPPEPPVVAPAGDGKPRLATGSRLREESGALLEARAALRAGDAVRSLALLEQARLRYPRGALGQEREALTIQALAQSGERAAAARRARVFLQAHPQSPYAADVRLVAAQ